MSKRIVVGLMVACLSLFGATACVPTPGGDTSGSQDHDPNDPDFPRLPSPPKEMPPQTSTYGVRVQAYKADGSPRGGRVTVHINATTVDPRATGGVAGGHVGPFPYDEIKSMPFQFPIYITPPITVSVISSFTSLITKGEKLACWLVNPYGGEIPHTRDEKVTTTDSPSNVQPQTVNCLGNFG